MAITIVGTLQINRSANGSNITLTFDVTPQADDLVILFGGTAKRTGTLFGPAATSPGYTELHSHTGTTDGSSPSMGVWAKFQGRTLLDDDGNVLLDADGNTLTEAIDTSVTGRGTGNAADVGAYGAWVLRGVDPAILDATITTAGETTSTNPNAPSIATNTAGAWVLAMALSGVNDGTPGTVSGYSNQGNASATDTNPLSVAGATKEVASPSTEDPAAWGTWSSGTWYAITVALKPGADNVSVTMDSLTMASALQDLVAVPGAVSVLQDVLSLVSSLEDLTVASEVTVPANSITLVASLEDLIITPGAISVLFDTLSMVSAAQGLTVFSEVNIANGTLELTVSPQVLEVIPGAVQLLLDVLSLMSSAEDSEVVAGAVSTLMDTLSLVASSEDIDVITVLGILLNSLTLVSSPENLTVIPGGFNVLTTSLTLASLLNDLIVAPGAVNTLLDALLAGLTLNDLTVLPGGVAVTADVLELLTSSVDLSVLPGAVSVLMGSVNLASSADDLANILAILITKLIIQSSDSTRSGVSVSDVVKTLGTGDATKGNLRVGDRN